jgi:hypothetical protein
LQRAKLQQGVWGDVGSCRGRHVVELREERGRTWEVTRRRHRISQYGEVDRQLRELACVANEVDLPHGDRAHALVVPYRHAGGRGCPTPPQDILDGDLGQDCGCSPKHGDRSGVSIDGEQPEAVEQQIESGAITDWRRQSPDCA